MELVPLIIICICIFVWLQILRAVATGRPIDSLLPAPAEYIHPFDEETSGPPNASAILSLIWIAVGLSMAFTARPGVPTAGGLAVSAVLSIVAGLLILCPIVLRVQAGGWNAHPFRFAFSDVKAALFGFFMGYLPVVIVMVVLSLIGQASEETQHPLLKLIARDNDSTILILTLLNAVIIAPLLEELVFRVVLQGSLSRYLPAHTAIVITAVVFSLAHGFPDALGLFPLALVFGWLYHVRASYWTVVIAHAIFNAYNVVVLLIAQDLIAG